VIIYASNQADVTQDIIRLFDQAYPVKASAYTGKASSGKASSDNDANQAVIRLLKFICGESAAR